VKKRTGKTIGVMVIDSRTQPLRLGNIGIALGVAGFRPVADDRGRRDLFGNVLRITRRAVADNLASACTAVIGESNESIPAALIRDAPAEFVDESFDSSEMWIPPTECMYMAIFNQWRQGGTS
jgi:F420-0:gamma-glutamyl ligase